jgi:hypothetical protein
MLRGNDLQRRAGQIADRLDEAADVAMDGNDSNERGGIFTITDSFRDRTAP